MTEGVRYVYPRVGEWATQRGFGHESYSEDNAYEKNGQDYRMNP